MKIVRFADGRDTTRLGLVVGTGIVALPRALPDLPTNMIGLIEIWDQVKATVAKVANQAPDIAVKDAKILAPVRRPGKVMAIGLNYADHIAESGQKTPDEQVWFAKQITSINDPYADIQIPKASSLIDYEAELVVVIGKRCKHVSKEEAPGAIFGYCIGNDVTARDWQFKTPQWILGKSFDTHGPIGPWIVTADEVGNPHELGIRAFVNGEKRQDSNTKNLVFNVYDQIAHLSKAMTLEPGDLIFTGTPGGVGAAMKPPTFLKAGDVVRIEIDKLGAIEGKMAPEQ
jgi:2-keto-4-pentenoate hydratase/2-oxohepta-3-ene-1,7-dioic acid hydratase in catechol pathway